MCFWVSARSLDDTHNWYPASSWRMPSCAFGDCTRLVSRLLRSLDKTVPICLRIHSTLPHWKACNTFAIWSNYRAVLLKLLYSWLPRSFSLRLLIIIVVCLFVYLRASDPSHYRCKHIQSASNNLMLSFVQLYWISSDCFLSYCNSSDNGYVSIVRCYLTSDTDNRAVADFCLRAESSNKKAVS